MSGGRQDGGDVYSVKSGIRDFTSFRSAYGREREGTDHASLGSNPGPWDIRRSVLPFVFIKIILI